MKLGIQLHPAYLSISNIVLIFVILGVERHRTTVHTWVQKADLQPIDGAEPAHVALDETVIQINDEWFRLYAAVDPEMIKLFYVKLSSSRNEAITLMFIAELREKHHVDDAVILIDSGAWLHAALHRHGLRFRYERYGNRNAVERVFIEGKRRTNQLSNTFNHVKPETAESWLQAFARCHNALI